MVSKHLSTKMEGKVKFFNGMKGFGFIIGKDGKEFFVHETGIKEGVNLHENDSVTFDVEKGDRGPKAVNVAKETNQKKQMPKKKNPVK